jgi:hypothetical protein
MTSPSGEEAREGRIKNAIDFFSARSICVCDSGVLYMEQREVTGVQQDNDKGCV